MKLESVQRKLYQTYSVSTATIMMTVNGKGAMANIRILLPSNFKCMKYSATRSAFQMANASRTSS